MEHLSISYLELEDLAVLLLVAQVPAALPVADPPDQPDQLQQGHGLVAAGGAVVRGGRGGVSVAGGVQAEQPCTVILHLTILTETPGES